jgi:hypothetical protein
MGKSNGIAKSHPVDFWDLLDVAIKADEKLKGFADHIRENIRRNLKVIYLPTIASGFVLAELKGQIISAILEQGPNPFTEWKSLLNEIMIRVNDRTLYATREQLDTWNKTIWPDMHPLQIGACVIEPSQFEERKRRLGVRGIFLDHFANASFDYPMLQRCCATVIETILLGAIAKGKIKPSPLKGMAEDIAAQIRTNPTWPDVELWQASVQDIDVLVTIFGCLERVPQSAPNGANVSPLVVDSHHATLSELALKWTLAANKGVSKDDIFRGNFRLAAEWRSNELALLDHAKAGHFSSLTMPLPTDISLALSRAITAREAVQFLTNNGCSTTEVVPINIPANPLTKDNGDPIAPPKQRSATHKESLIAAARALKLDLEDLPKYPEGKASAKAAIKKRMGPPYTNKNDTTFENTWVAMKKSGELIPPQPIKSGTK